MWPAFIWLWILGGSVAAVLIEVARAESTRIAMAGKVAFAFWVSLLLLGVAVLFAWQNTAVGKQVSSRSGWWVVAILGGLPVTALCAIGMLKAYRGRRAWLLGGMLLATGLYVLFPLGYEPPGQRLHGVARLEHLHHVLDVIALSLPALVLLVGALMQREPSD